MDHDGEGFLQVKGLYWAETRQNRYEHPTQALLGGSFDLVILPNIPNNPFCKPFDPSY